MKKAVLIVVALGAAFLLALVAFNLISASGGLSPDTHMTIAFVLGVAVSFILGVGLMSLIFYSSRNNHDR